jgi:membrane protein YdbS with pleckstrin-like domain
MTVADDQLLAEAGDAASLSPEPPRQADIRVQAEPEVRTLDPRCVPQQRAVGWIVSACVSLAMLVMVALLSFAPGLPWLLRVLLFPGWAVVSAGMAWLFYAWPAVHFRHVSYLVNDDGIQIRTGVWWREVLSVPRSRVQHIDVSQGPLERAYGLGRLVLYTAGTSHSRVELGGLAHGVALELRNHLMPRGGDDAV